MAPRKREFKDPNGFDLFNYPTAFPVTCSRCGGIFEGPIKRPDGSIQHPGHVAGDPRDCIPTAPLTGNQRDARARKAMRGAR